MNGKQTKQQWHTLAHTAGTATHALQWQTKVISHRNDRKAAVDFCIAYFCGSLNCATPSKCIIKRGEGISNCCLTVTQLVSQTVIFKSLCLSHTKQVEITLSSCTFLPTCIWEIKIVAKRKCQVLSVQAISAWQLVWLCSLFLQIYRYRHRSFFLICIHKVHSI